MNDNTMNVSNTPPRPEIEVPIPDTVVTPEALKTIPDYDDNFTIEMIIQKILKEDKQYDLSKIISA